MKLRDFQKKHRTTKKPSKIVLQNDALELKYKAQIEELDSQLGHYRRIEAERDEALTKANSLEETLKSERFEFDKSKETILTLEQTVLNQNEELKKIPLLEESSRNSQGESNSLRVELEDMTKRAVNQSQDLAELKKQLGTLQIENKDLIEKTTEAISVKHSTNADFEAISNKNKELQSFTDETSKINKELIEDNKTLRDWVNYKEVENTELEIQLEELKSVETKLREWMGKMETKDSKNTSSKNSLENKISTQQKVIADMSNTLEDVIKEMAYITKLNSGYRKQLAQPTYTSTSAIASQEGFVIPNGKENLRTHNLGRKY